MLARVSGAHCPLIALASDSTVQACADKQCGAGTAHPPTRAAAHLGLERRPRLLPQAAGNHLCGARSSANHQHPLRSFLILSPLAVSAVSVRRTGPRCRPRALLARAGLGRYGPATLPVESATGVWQGPEDRRAGALPDQRSWWFAHVRPRNPGRSACRTYRAGSAAECSAACSSSCAAARSSASTSAGLVRKRIRERQSSRSSTEATPGSARACSARFLSPMSRTSTHGRKTVVAVVPIARMAPGEPASSSSSPGAC